MSEETEVPAVMRNKISIDKEDLVAIGVSQFEEELHQKIAAKKKEMNDVKTEIKKAESDLLTHKAKICNDLMDRVRKALQTELGVQIKSDQMRPQTITICEDQPDLVSIDVRFCSAVLQVQAPTGDYRSTQARLVGLGESQEVLTSECWELQNALDGIDRISRQIRASMAVHFLEQSEDGRQLIQKIQKKGQPKELEAKATKPDSGN
jgi:hypothetical protein